MATVRGTRKDDTLNGTAEADRIVGLAGNDRLFGGAGDDVILGGDGNDTINDTDGSDTIDAGDGDDEFYGNRSLLAGADTVRADMGAGDDRIFFGSPAGGSLTADLGSGTDRITLYDANAAVTITTGEGADTVGLFVLYRLGDHVPEVTDFTAGDLGDRLDIASFLAEETSGWFGNGNPFARGRLRLVADGDATALEVDADDHRPGHHYVPLMRLDGVDPAQLTAANLSGFAPDGSRTPGLRIEDGEGWTSISGSVGADRLHGGGGDDRIDGGVGKDHIWGDAGRDYLIGGPGDDQLFGGDGDDTLNDDGGSNLLDGGAGNDTIYHQVGFGGGGSAEETIFGGTGDDYVRLQNFRSGSLTVDLGDGADQLDLYTIQDGGARVTTGAGRDVVTVRDAFASSLTGALEITDFTAGWTGDRLQLGYWLRLVTDWRGVGDPFAGGFLRLEQANDATLVRADRDGTGSGGATITLVRLDGVVSTDLTAGNFFEGFDPHAPAAPLAGDYLGQI